MIVASVDRLGYLRCLDCHSESFIAQTQATAVEHDNGAHNGEACDMCERFVLAVAYETLERRAPFAESAESHRVLREQIARVLFAPR